MGFPEFPADKDCYITFRTYTESASDLLPKDYEIANDQILLSKGVRACVAESKDAVCSVDGTMVKLQNGDAVAVFDTEKGYLASYKVGGKEMFNEDFGMRPDFWRAPNDNDYGCWWPARTQVFKEASNSFMPEVTVEGNAIVARYGFGKESEGAAFVARYSMCGESLKVDFKFAGAKTSQPIEIPRIGFRMRLPESADAFSYYGRGPWENYCDRFTSCFVGKYESSAEKEFVPYVRPQECGHHIGCQTLNIGNLKVTGEEFEFSALRCSVEDLDAEEAVGKEYQYDWKDPAGNYTPEAARNNLRRHVHVNDIPVRDYVELCIDGAQSGIGGYDSWGARAETERTLWNNRDYGFSIVLNAR